MANDNSAVRYHSLDAFRAFAMLLGIILHAAWLFMPEAAGSPTTDVAAHKFFSYLVYAIHAFRMQAFFLVAGFFACLVASKRGIWNLWAAIVSRVPVDILRDKSKNLITQLRLAIEVLQASQDRNNFVATLQVEFDFRYALTIQSCLT